MTFKNELDTMDYFPLHKLSERLTRSTRSDEGTELFLEGASQTSIAKTPTLLWSRTVCEYLPRKQPSKFFSVPPKLRHLRVNHIRRGVAELPKAGASAVPEALDCALEICKLSI